MKVGSGTIYKPAVKPAVKQERNIGKVFAMLVLIFAIAFLLLTGFML